MKNPKKHERAALEAVAQRFSAAGKAKRVAVQVAALEGRGTGPAAKPRLRFDKVVVRLLEGLRATLGRTVPDGTTVLLTVTAPIRLAAKTEASIEDRVRALLARGSRRRDGPATIHGNRVRIRIWSGGPRRGPRMIGFVHNPETDARLLLDMSEEWLELMSAAAGRRATKATVARWLVVVSLRPSSCLEAYRTIHAQAGRATGFEKILLVFRDGRVETLTEGA